VILVWELSLRFAGTVFLRGVRGMSFDYDVDELEPDSAVEVADEDFDLEEEEVLEFDELDFEALGIDPAGPTAAKPGSPEKVLMLAARYAAGVPLWHDKDCYDHGPGDLLARLARGAKS